MSGIEKSIYVNVPVDSAYALWTRFEDYPQFMDDVQEVRRLDEKALLWRYSRDGSSQEEEAVLTHHVPNQRLAWRSTSAPDRTTSITFAPTGAHSARVSMRMGYGAADTSSANQLGPRAEAVLKRFKEIAEAEYKAATPAASATSRQASEH